MKVMTGGHDGAHLVEVEVGDLGTFALAEESLAAGLPRQELARLACDRLITELTSGRISAIPPALEGTPEGTGQRVAVELDHSQWRTLQAEAKLRGIGVEGMVAHAIVSYLATF